MIGTEHPQTIDLDGWHAPDEPSPLPEHVAFAHGVMWALVLAVPLWVGIVVSVAWWLR